MGESILIHVIIILKSLYIYMYVYLYFCVLYLFDSQCRGVTVSVSVMQ